MQRLVLTAWMLMIAAGPAAAQFADRPYAFPNNDRTLAARQQMQERANSRITINQYHSSSTSIGNLTEITQQLGAGANGSLSLDQTQNSQGNQGSSSSLGLNEIESLTRPR